MTFPNDAERRALTDICMHEGLHKACDRCSDTIFDVTEALREHVAAREAQAAAKALREAAEALPAFTEGEGREGIRAWKQPAQDAYSIAVEEAQSALCERADRIERGEP